MEATQRRHEADYDKRLHWEPTIRVGDEVYIDRPHHASFASEAAKELTYKE